jgi:hypothetical protein
VSLDSEPCDNDGMGFGSIAGGADAVSVGHRSETSRQMWKREGVFMHYHSQPAVRLEARHTCSIIRRTLDAKGSIH